MQPQQKHVPQAPPPPSRMTLANLVKGKQEQPARIVLFGPEGCGKSTFGANAPAPIFLGAEDGTHQLNVERFPTPETWAEVLEAIRTLTQENHGYKTLVVDTLDWAEPLLWAFICKRDGQANVEAYGYGKGYQAALDEWRVFLSALERLRRTKPMHVLLLAHSWIKAFKNPEGEDFDRYEMKLNNKASGLIKEWSDAVLFANYETYANKDAKTKRVKGVDTGARLIHTERRAAFDAKNRYGLPESLPLDWQSFEEAMRSGQPADPEALTQEIRRKAEALDEAAKKKVEAAIERAAGDATKLSQLNSIVNATLQKGEQ